LEISVWAVQPRCRSLHFGDDRYGLDSCSASIVPISGIGAILFVISDVSVARDRFVKQDIGQQSLGIPLYYIAQLLFAASVITAV
jgi:hypothetical protein